MVDYSESKNDRFDLNLKYIRKRILHFQSYFIYIYSKVYFGYVAELKCRRKNLKYFAINVQSAMQGKNKKLELNHFSSKVCPHAKQSPSRVQCSFNSARKTHNAENHGVAIHMSLMSI